MRQNERERDEEQSLPRRRNDACPQRHGNVLKQHIAHNDKAGDRERDALQPQRQRTDADNLGIVAPKYRNDLRCKSKAEHCERQQDQRGGSDAEVKAPRHAVVLMRAEIEPADRLKTLSEADHRGACELADARDDAHRRNRCIAIGPRRCVQAGHGNRCKALPAQARNSAARQISIARR